MRKLLRQSIPSMFHRRLLLLAGLAALTAGALCLQAGRLATGRAHAELLAEAEAAMVRETLIPTVRGRILDRRGRVLAVDRPGWSLRLPYELFTGAWAYDAARARAAAEAGRAWRSMNPEAREAAVEPRLGGFQRQQAIFWTDLPDLLGVDPAEVAATRDRVVRRVGVVKAQYIGRRLAERRRDSGDAGVGWEDIDDDTVAEELATHVIAAGVGDAAADRLKVFAAEAAAKAAAADLAGATDADRDAAAASAVWREVRVERTRDRVYPRTVAEVSVDRRDLPDTLASEEPARVRLPGVALHVLGQLKPLYAGAPRMQARPLVTRAGGGPGSGSNPGGGGGSGGGSGGAVDLGGYMERDPAGHFGVERVLESTLRGARGRQVQRLEEDADGVRRVTRTEPVPGEDVTLTLDAGLQAYLEALLSEDPAVGLMRVQPWHKASVPLGTPLHGALVVVEIATGEVLAAASAPGVSRERLEEDPASVYADFTFEPWTFRPAAYARAPGSTVKPLVLAAAVSDGVLAPGERVDVSRGHLYPNQPNYFRDWWVKIGGRVDTLDGPTAVKVSGNVFFGELAQRLGPERLAQRYRALGFAQKAGLPLREAAGTLWDPADPNPGPEADQTAIGQGRLTVTPLQLAAAHATLARGGRHLPPRLVRDARLVRGGAVTPETGLAFTPEAVSEALLGMWKSGNEGAGPEQIPGTTYRFSLPPGPDGRRRYHRNFTAGGVDVFAKSGTAQGGATVEKFDDDGDGRVDRTGALVNADNHAWAVALVGPAGRPPLYSVVAMVEHGVSGGTAAGPLVHEAVVALQRFGYLPGKEPDGERRVVFPDAERDPLRD